MIRLSNFLIALAVIVALAPATAARPDEKAPETIDSLWLGEQVAGDRLTEGDLEGRVVLVYAWCVS